MMTDDDWSHCIIAAQGALLCTVTSHLRAVTVSLFDEKIDVSFFFDGSPTEIEIESAQIAATEISEGVFVNERVSRLDSPTVIPVRGSLVYLRKESLPLDEQVRSLNSDGSVFFTKGIRNCPSIDIKWGYLATAYVLLGLVTPDLRSVTFDVHGNTFELIFFFDGEISKAQTVDCELAFDRLEDELPAGTTLLKKIERVDCPGKIPVKGQLAYNRWEDTPPGQRFTST